MIDTKKITKRKRGRPKGSRTTFIGRNVGLRLYPDLEAKVDAWIAQQDEELSRPEALRRLIERGLDSPATKPRRKRKAD
jgi:hypothetical protein